MKNIAKKSISKNIKKIEKKFEILKGYLSRENWSNADEMFFSFEQLPPHGKEYWFMIFTSNEPAKGKQLMITLGSQNSKKYTVDDCEINKRINDDGIRNGPFSFWFYDKKIYKSKTMSSIISMKDNMMCVDSDKANFIIRGKYPNYTIKLKKDCKIIGDIRTKKGSDHKGYELNEYFKGAIGVGYLNLLLDFNGLLNGSKFNGQCYVQKVVITAFLPSVPWYWGRVCFADKSVLSFLYPHISISKLSKEFSTSGYFWDAKEGKAYMFERIDVRKFGGNNRQFFVSGKTDECEFTLLAKSYAQKKFSISSIGNLKYEQNLIKSLNFSFETGEKFKTEKNTGKGIGILEDAYGYAI